jgi:hypothetical protein
MISNTSLVALLYAPHSLYPPLLGKERGRRRKRG